MPKQNFLLGRGERLTEDVTVRSGGGPKQAPYTFSEARTRLTPMLGQAVKEVDALPADACPRDQVVLSLTLNPEYIAKSYFPAELLRDVGVEVVGSRPKKVKPEKRSVRRRAPSSGRCCIAQRRRPTTGQMCFRWCWPGSPSAISSAW